MRTLIVGHGARESALGAAMAQSSALHAFMGHANPSLVALTKGSGGGYRLGDVCAPAAVTDYAAEAGVDLAMVSADDPLAAGVVDALHERGIATVGPTRAGAEIEWSKAFSRELLADVDPEACPRCVTVASAAELSDAFEVFGDAPLVVKPDGLTGGKGVKVMGPHLASHAEAREYAQELLERGGPALIEERLDGPEFTIQAISDGRTVICPPATYDYPYRYEGDTGPGTGGMGSFSVAGGPLPFIDPGEYERGREIVRKVIARLAAMGRHFSGVMNSGFFATPNGVRVIEFNARFGDPECMNIMPLFDGDWVAAMRAIAEQRLTGTDVPLRDEASVVVYLVPPSYAVGPGESVEFELDQAAIEADDCHVFFSAAERIEGDRYRTLGTSRAVAVAATAPQLETARTTVLASVERHVRGPLQWRADIAAADYVTGLRDARPAFGRIAS
jgi:phosphoribosylamine--glycine ligase